MQADLPILIIIFPKHGFMARLFSFYTRFPKIYQSSANTETRNRKYQNLAFRIFKYCRRSFIVFLTVFQETTFRDFYLSKCNWSIIVLILKIRTTRIFAKNKECKYFHKIISIIE